MIPLHFWDAVSIVAVVSIFTFLVRLAPFVIFGGNKKQPKSIRYIGKYLPPAVIAVLIIYCLKNINWISFPGIIPHIIAIFSVIIIHKIKRNNLLSIGAGTVIYMLLVQFVFI